MRRTRLYRDGELVAENFPVTEISEHIDAPGVTIWLDLSTPNESDLRALSEELDLHPLSVEDAIHQQQRPKLDRYRDHLFLDAYAVGLDEVGALRTAEVSAFVTRNALVTVRPGEDFDIDAVVSRWDSSPDLASHGVAFLLYGLLDTIVDGHFESVQRLDEMIDELEDALFDAKVDQTALQRRSFGLRRDIVRLRRFVLPMREVVNALLRRDLLPMDDAMVPYYHDVYDHVLRASEWTESLRDMVSTILETLLTIQGNRMNLVMKKITAWAAIIAVPTAVTGFYGMNVPYPGFANAAGLYTSLAAIVALSVALYLLFRHSDWL